MGRGKKKASRVNFVTFILKAHLRSRMVMCIVVTGKVHLLTDNNSSAATAAAFAKQFL